MDRRHLFRFLLNDNRPNPPQDTDTANEHGAVGDENVERGNWSSKTDYLLSMIGNAVGFGNVWRFPYLAYKNGGGAFLIPYSVMLALVGIPLFFLECSFGQFASLGPVAVWRAVPMLQGVGIAMMLLITMSNISYNCIVGYSLYYLFASFQSPLPTFIQQEIKQIEHQSRTVLNDTANEHGAVGDENVERGNWSSKTDYLLSMIGNAVGFGNVWRFPYLAYKNGGGAFLIPYSVMLALVGIPLFFLECSFGQFASLGPVAVWRAVPMLQGVGIAMMLLITMSNISYNCIVGYSLYYLFASFQSPLPWADCFSWWGADETCSRTPKGTTLCNLTLSDGYFEIVNITQLQENNGSCPNGSEISNPHQGPSEQYWDKAVLCRSSSMDETGEVIWYLAFCLLLAWLIVGTALSKGIKSSGKVVYFTATFPYVVLTILLIRGVTLEGASKGIEFYIGSQSDFSRLADAEVWKDAATQIFFSISVGWGTLVALSSYNKFHNNCYRDTIIVCVVNCASSVFAGFGIFFILGHMAHRQDKPVSEVAQSGFGLVFIAYPEALAQLPWAPLWSVSFFFMLLTLGVDTQFAGLETVMTALQDQFPTLVQSKRLLLTAGVCSLFYLLGLLCVTQAGIYWLNLLDHYVTDWILVITALLQLIGLSWIYGTNRFIKDIEVMIGERTWLFWLWWRMCWILISPCLLVAVLIWSLTTFAPLRYGSVEYPVWSGALGWCMTIFCIMWIPIMAVVRVVQAEGPTLWQKISAACTSAPDWGPYLEQHRGERYRKKPDSTEDPNCVHLLVIPEK
ncbi:sodium- and chloride-dependent neutral and basic amino acid transporter B(0+)-like [Hemiscyllium ocellatum]|uniref:sodium- and chloride-dependent neutral and basic amino acid transporter B(0+)-like n=1 Tax=Hemiscyllium ocellatum TaxID=170820 RepID=UPI00296707E6|nr:sodium- and chloride-dependent neutral and basic amino acid transporter B(0+)-like [Hemiscyllium ocellatum]